jgi:type IV pilus assembly protein PilP
MKRLIYFFLIGCITLGFGGCSGKNEQPAPVASPQVETKQKVEPIKPVSTEEVAQVQEYEIKGTRDPFQPFEKKAKLKITKNQTASSLENFSLSQVRLVGIIWGKDKRALVQDSSGMGYVIKEGMRLGEDLGVVVRISPDSVTIRQKFTDYKGRVSNRDVVLSLKKEEGED